MTDKFGNEIKNGDKVEITFYSYDEPLCSCEGIVNDEYLQEVKGSIPLRECYTREVELIERGNKDG